MAWYTPYILFSVNIICYKFEGDWVALLLVFINAALILDWGKLFKQIFKLGSVLIVNKKMWNSLFFLMEFVTALFY